MRERHKQIYALKTRHYRNRVRGRCEYTLKERRAMCVAYDIMWNQITDLLTKEVSRHWEKL